MRKALFILVLLLSVYSVALADRITPTEQIGLFVDPDLFDKCITKSDLNKIIYERDTNTYDWSQAIFKSYWFDDGSFLTLLVDQLGKYSRVSSIGFTFGPEWSLDSAYIQNIIKTVLTCSGLPYTETDQAINTLVSQEEFLNETYGITYSRDYEVGSQDIDIYSWYWFNYYKIDPYSRMKYYHTSCDSNYVGACIPIVSYDLDCSDIGVRNFFAVGNDFHHFDSDGNGVCCEPYPPIN